jgi:ATP-dependent RNA helicase SUPV3L1/SUV3
VIRQTKYKYKKLFDISEPHLWYPNARNIPRKIICHIGPTNSGKTYNALDSLTNAKTGLYCGPLRLLAWEIYEKLSMKNIKCNLITGQEKNIHDNATHQSCTVEMIDLYNYYDCVVIDEAQLIGDVSRGWAWTQALLGLQAKEIHLCGMLYICNNNIINTLYIFIVCIVIYISFTLFIYFFIVIFINKYLTLLLYICIYLIHR